MRLLLACSADGFFAKGAQDDMTWTPPIDKAVFRLLTLSDAEPLVAGATTFSQMPSLKGRALYKLSRSDLVSGLTLEGAYALYPRAWLIGGPAVAEAALHAGMVSRAFIVRNGVRLAEGLSARPVLSMLPSQPAQVIRLASDVFVDIYTEEQEWPEK